METLRLPAEWENQWAVQLTWPHAGTDWYDMLDEISCVYLDVARAVTREEHLIVVTPEPLHVRRQLMRVLTEEQMSRVMFVLCDTDDTWARDHAFISLIGDGERRLLDFHFNGWGGKYPAEKDNAVNRRLYDQLGCGVYEDDLDFVLEGGSIDCNGRGTLITTESCLLNANRERSLDKAGIERELLRRLRASRVIWLRGNRVEGDDTDGHIDTIVRFAPDNTLLYISDDAVEEQVKTVFSSDSPEGSYRLLSLPPVTGPCRSYANFLVINKAVLCPVYRQPELDRRAMTVLAQAFPDREIIAIDALPITRENGSLHCCAMQYPAVTPRGENY